MSKIQEFKTRNPGVSSMISLCLYLAVIVGVWTAVAGLLFPQESVDVRAKAYVDKYEGVLSQVAENAMDATKWEGILYAEDSKRILAEGNVLEVYADNYGASFAISGKGIPENGLARILYRPEGEYVFNRKSAVWSLKEETETTQKWVGGANQSGYVEVLKLADCFYLEIAVEPS